MKKVEMYIRPEKLDTMKDILSKHGCHGMSIFTVMGCGRQKGYVAEMASPEFSVNLLPKICVVSVIEDKELDEMLLDINDQVGSATVGDGKVFVYDVYDVMRIRTGERGSDAL